jgi:hypothetical protein
MYVCVHIMCVCKIPNLEQILISPVTSNPGYLCSQSTRHLEGLSDSSYGFSQHQQGLRLGPPPDHR